MSEYIALAIFLVGFAVLIKKDTVYLIPMILLFYSNLNGLVGWESFALKGVVKFQDYGLVLVCCLLFYNQISAKKIIVDYEENIKSSALFNINNIYWIFLIGLFVFSVFAMGSLIWAVKMARTFFYGLVYFVIVQELKIDPIGKFEKVINILGILTVLAGMLYVAYNKFNFDIYPKGEHESFDLGYLLGEVKRNFSGFPVFSYYFILLFTDRLMDGRGKLVVNIFGLLVLLASVFFMLTRGALLLTLVMIPAMMLFRRLSSNGMVRILLVILVVMIGFAALPYVAEGQYVALSKRFDEIAAHGFAGSDNMQTRTNEFIRIVKNVVDFDPLFGFGFMLPAAFGYISDVYHGGSADNGIANIIGVSGIVGLVLFAMVIGSWIIANKRLRALNVENFSRVHFIFIIVTLVSAVNGANMSYLWNWNLFMAYDMLALAYFTKRREVESVAHMTLPVLSPIRF